MNKHIIWAIIAPFDGIFNGRTKFVTSNRPVILRWLEATAEEVLVLRGIDQRHGNTSKNALQTNQPCIPFCIYFVSSPHNHINRIRELHYYIYNYHDKKIWFITNPHLWNCIVENQLFFCLPNPVINDKKNCYTTTNNLVKGPDEGSKKVSVNDLTQDLDSPCLWVITMEKLKPNRGTTRIWVSLPIRKRMLGRPVQSHSPTLYICKLLSPGGTSGLHHLNHNAQTI